jgi:hypothetical protein
MKKIFTTLFALLSILSATAQIRQDSLAGKYPNRTTRFTIGTQPLYIFNTGVRFDFEMRIKNTPAWIQISTTGYWRPYLGYSDYYYDDDGYRHDEGYDYDDYNYEHNATIGEDDLNSFSGAGLEVNYKYFFNRPQTLYVAGGGSYTRYNIKYAEEYWRSYTEDGLEYLTREYGDIKQGINKFGANIYFGYQMPRPTFLFDVFVGIGYRHSFRTNAAGRPFNDTMLSLGYSGIVAIAGIRLGVKF